MKCLLADPECPISTGREEDQKPSYKLKTKTFTSEKFKIRIRAPLSVCSRGCFLLPAQSHANDLASLLPPPRPGGILDESVCAFSPIVSAVELARLHARRWMGRHGQAVFVLLLPVEPPGTVSLLYRIMREEELSFVLVPTREPWWRDVTEGAALGQFSRSRASVWRNSLLTSRRLHILSISCCSETDEKVDHILYNIFVTPTFHLPALFSFSFSHHQGSLSSVWSSLSFPSHSKKALICGFVISLPRSLLHNAAHALHVGPTAGPGPV